MIERFGDDYFPQITPEMRQALIDAYLAGAGQARHDESMHRQWEHDTWGIPR